MDFRFDIIMNYGPLLFKGTLFTIGISLVSILLGLIGGLIIGFAKMSRYALLIWPAQAYINFFRGTPLYVQILIAHFGLVPFLTGSTNAWLSSILALSLNSAAYCAEIYRAGVQSIDKGQTEAAFSLGMGYWDTMRHIILPQAVKRMIPAFGNEFIVLVKDSSLCAIVAAQEIMYWSNAMRGQYMRVWEPYLTAALIYFVLTYSLNKLLVYIERKV